MSKLFGFRLKRWAFEGTLTLDWKPTLGFTVSWNSVVVGLVFFEFYLTWYRRFV